PARTRAGAAPGHPRAGRPALRRPRAPQPAEVGLRRLRPGAPRPPAAAPMSAVAAPASPVYPPDQLKVTMVEVWIEYSVPASRAHRRNHRARAEWFSGQLPMGTEARETLAGAVPRVTELAQRLLHELASRPLLTMRETRV